MTPQPATILGGHDAPEDAAILPAEIRCQLERMLASRTFRTAEGQKSFLKYAVEEVLAGRASQIKEYLIGVEAFSRGDLFDPRLDPIVRTQARKLRARLVKYYLTEGVDDPIRIEFPKGSYAPTFSRVAEAPAAARPIPVPTGHALVEEPRLMTSVAPPPASFPRNWTMAAVSAALLAVVLAVAFSFYAARERPFEPAPETTSSVAVLPFVNLNGDSANEFLSDGLTDDLIESLGQAPGLRVAGRTSDSVSKESRSACGRSASNSKFMPF